MTREQLLKFCKEAGEIGTVKYENYMSYIVVMTNRKKGDNGWETTETPYMAVDGRVRMARDDHRNQNKKLDMYLPTILVDNDDTLTLSVCVESEVYGKASGTATSRKIEGTSSERQFPYETAETSALGRALGELGYGIFAGAGLTSAEDMQRAQASGNTETPKTNKPAIQSVTNKTATTASPAQPTQTTVTTQTSKENETTNAPAAQATQTNKSSRKPQPISDLQKKNMTAKYIELRGGDETQAKEGLEKLFQEQFKVSMNEATYEQAARMMAVVLAELREKQKETK